ncbi:type II toxin-antitoxin system prevent-host-death family antitoxin [Candidatus Oleimmundimicrobium sp.]|uniref:type II toxin-antitoxin system Phd/YefM family antitoxin n=1 Tax=Candidatus Oleimmundimicrobium sp. TaxID=3060597 RepID=UPI002724CB45|nr:type II toxin-antitoxin system prevent-host-death family antitoxin [Candidatus Oleimmundimicrobium sp.]MDO8886335.1 type II toxin-antitoxin system prevent-host-death family antitoxin [Candidatus Oleimmundimicrobium sp.]
MLNVLGLPFIGTDKLRKKLTSLIKDLKKEQGEVIVTHRGEPVAVLTSIDRYLEEQQAFKEFSDPSYIKALLEAKTEIREGKGIPAEEVFKKKGL